MIQFGVLKIQNFFRVKSLQIDLNSPGLNLVEGENLDVGTSNEAGKSTIFEALCWCLYGRYAAGGARAGNEIVNPMVKKNCQVSVEVLTESEKYTIIRSRLLDGSKSSRLSCYAVGAEVDIEQEVVNQLLGLDYDTFVRVAYFPQENLIPFGRMSDKALKDFFLEKVLDITWLNKAREKAKEELKEREDDFITINHQIEMNEMRLVRCQQLLDDYWEKNSEWAFKQAEKLLENRSKIKLEAADILSMKVKAKKFKGKYQELQSEIGKEKSFLMGLQSDLTQIKRDQRQAEETFRKIDQEVIYVEKKLEDLNDKIKKIEDSPIKKCPLCGSILSTVDDVLSHYNQEIAVTSQPLKSLKEKRTKFFTKQEEIQQHVDMKQREIEGLSRKIRDLEGSEDRLAELNLKSTISKLLPGMKERSGVIKKLRREISPYTHMIKKEMATLEELKKSQAEDSINLLSITKDVEVLRFWDLAFSPQGIQSYLLDKVTPVINRLVSKYLMELANGRISVTFNTVKKLASGAYKENFSVDIQNLDGGSTYTSLSGGAKKRIDAATSLALADFKRSLTNRELKFACFDESTSGMDQVWTERFLDLIERRFSGYSTYYVSHQPVDRSRFKRTIVVKKEGGETRI